MTLQDVEKELESAWKALVAEVHSLFHKQAEAPVEAAVVAPSPVVEVAPAVEVQPASVTFDPAQYPDAASRMAAAQALLASLVAKWGNYQTKIVGPHGYEIQPSGMELFPEVNPHGSYWSQDPDGAQRIALADASGRWQRVTGPAVLKTLVPADFRGKVWAMGNLCPGTVYPVTSTVNGGDSKVQSTDAAATHAMVCFGVDPGSGEVSGTAGQDLVFSVDQEAASNYVVVFQVYPSA